MNPGGWSSFTTEITSAEMEIFNNAKGKLMGIVYEPLAVATQVVSGIKYKFFCNATVTYPDAPSKPVMVTIYDPANGEAHIESIENIK